MSDLFAPEHLREVAEFLTERGLPISAQNCRAAAALIERLDAERDAAIARAEAAEAQVERLREAAKPFVEFEKTMRLWKTGNVASWGSSIIQEAVPDWEMLLKGSYPIDEPTSQSVIVRAAHIRALARAALADKEPADG